MRNMKRSGRSSLIAKANESVRVEDMLNELFGEDVPHDAGNWRVTCPASELNTINKREKARVYSESNQVYCFSHRMAWGPVGLWKIYTGGTKDLQAAKELLNYFEIPHHNKTPEERWEDLNNKESKLNAPLVKSVFQSRLKRTVPDSRLAQFTEYGSAIINKYLKEADELPTDADYDTLKHWLDSALERIKKDWEEQDVYNRAITDYENLRRK